MLRNLKSFNLPEIEERVLSFWKEKDIFQKTLKSNRAGANGKTFNFWEGPPTANGRPGLHHVLARSFKDIILRYKTMQGYTVPRRAGWDTHGLPVELQVEKQLGLSSKKEIEKYGIAAFNQACKESVWTYKSEWEKLTERMGYWLDLAHPYITYENGYIEALWGIIKRISDAGLLEQGHKVVPWCPRCGTALSSHEVAQGYKTVTDNSVYVKFKIKDQKSKLAIGENTYVLSWTTTPWTLPGNVALAVGPAITYAIFQNEETGERLIVADSKGAVAGEGFKKSGTIQGKDLVGLAYEPLFKIPAIQTAIGGARAYKIYPADFVTEEDGTGIVHTAVMYGEDDYKLGKKIGLPQLHTVDETGKFTADVKELSGLFVKNPQTEEKIFDILKKRGNLFSILPYEHEYPHCWRCSTPLLYYARTSWFVKISKLRKQLLAANEKINWMPSHVKHGRFGEWLKEAKDWNFSRERYWGTPLPIWKCESCSHVSVIGTFEELGSRADRGNSYIIMRHGQATSNVDGWLAGGTETGKFVSKLTKTGMEQVRMAGEKIKKEGIDIIYASPYRRTRETADSISKITGARVVFDKRLSEINFGVFNHKKVTEYKLFYAADGRTEADRFTIPPEKGETLHQVRARALDFLKDIDGKYEKKKILVVSHGDVLWMLQSALKHLSNEKTMQDTSLMFENGAHKKISYDHIPTDSSGSIDPHRPYSDETVISCEKCGASMRRVPEVADVWFDSGSMPFASKAGYPADYICEAMDQTRGWFYTLLAVSTLLGAKLPPYKNVISLGLIHDKFGQKMSKSKGNTVDPWALMQKYGADAVRWHFFTLNAPGDAKNFDESEVMKTLRRFLFVAYNSFSFLHLYGKKGISLATEPAVTHVLDEWILQRTAETSGAVFAGVEKYDITKAAQALESFTDDLSRWYIRRSRKRFQKNEDARDWERASATLGYVMLTYAKLLAPFAPFFAEALFQSLKKDYTGITEESVHLSIFSKPRNISKKDDMSEHMRWARDISSFVLAKRAELQIKVRQPLSKLTVRQLPKSKRMANILEIVRDEINVKDIVADASLQEEFILNTEITPELKTEGMLREFVRTVQGLRQEAGYIPTDVIELWMTGSEQMELLVQNSIKETMKQIGAKKFLIGKNDKVDAQTETKIDEYKSWIGIRKIS